MARLQDIPRTQAPHVWWALLWALTGVAVPAYADWPTSPVQNVPVCTASGAAGFRSLYSDGVGGLLVAWTDTRSDSADIYVQRMTAGGTPAWTVNGLLVSGALSDQDQATVTTDGSGGAIVAWRDMREGPTGDLYVQRVSSAGTLAWAAGGVKVCGAVNEQANPVLVPDGFGGAVVIWEDYRSGVAIYAQRVRFDGQPMWAADGVRLSTNPSPQFEPVACSDGTGGALVVWEQQSAGAYDVAAQWVDIAGLRRWGATGVVVCGATNDQVNAQLAPDGIGGAVVAWEDYRAGEADIYAQRLSTFGVPLFAANGTPVCTVAGDQHWPQLAPDAGNGAIITWQDERMGEADIYAQRWSGANGARLWPVSGVSLCGSAGAQQFPTLTRDGQGGAIVVWEDMRNGSSDIFAQRIDEAGVRRWVNNGLPVSSAVGSQYQPVVAPDEDSVAVLVWVDQRTGGNDLYAQRVPFVVTLDAPSPSEPHVALSASPDPARQRSELAFDVPRAGRVALVLHDAAGRRVRTLIDGIVVAGRQRVVWDGHDDQGAALEAGVYFARVTLDGRGLAVRSIRLVR